MKRVPTLPAESLSLFDEADVVFSSIRYSASLTNRISTAQRRKQERFSLDELFEKSQCYRRSQDYLKLVEFVGKFREHAPFNVALIHTQNPDAQYVLTAREWENRFGCRVKRLARPLVILWPFAPVHFVYDVADVEPKNKEDSAPIPDEIRRPFQTDGSLQCNVLELTIENCRRHAIAVRDDLEGIKDAGQAMRLTRERHAEYKDLKLMKAACFLILLNKNHSREEKYSSLCHEIAHIFCGHLGTVPWAWWESRTQTPPDVEEIEAESVAYLVCQRHGLEPASDKYLARCRECPEEEMPPIGLHAIIQAVDDIERMGTEMLKKPLHKPHRGFSR